MPPMWSLSVTQPEPFRICEFSECLCPQRRCGRCNFVGIYSTCATILTYILSCYIGFELNIHTLSCMLHGPSKCIVALLIQFFVSVFRLSWLAIMPLRLIWRRLMSDWSLTLWSVQPTSRILMYSFFSEGPFKFYVCIHVSMSTTLYI